MCCTFITVHYPIRSDDLKRYFNLHGVDSKSDSEGGMYLKFPVQCNAWNPKTKRCSIHEDKPDVCKRYPQKPSPFIPKEQCSMFKVK